MYEQAAARVAATSDIAIPPSLDEYVPHTSPESSGPGSHNHSLQPQARHDTLQLQAQVRVMTTLAPKVSGQQACDY